MHRFRRPIRAAAFALALAVPTASAVPLWADILGSDADVLNGGAQSSITLSATPGQTLTFPVSLFVECQTKAHMDGATTVSYHPGTSTVPAGGTLAATSVTIARPAGWPLDSQNCGATAATPAQTSTVTLGAPAVTGTYGYSLHWSSSDGGVDSSPHGKVDVTLNVATPAPTDTTPPVITRTVSGTLGLDDWYTSAVTVSWSVSDPESPVTIDEGCGVQSFTSDDADGSSTCAATSAGGSASDIASFKIDQTGPAPVGASFSRPADNAGWYNHPVDVIFDGSDATSGIASCDTITYSGPDGSARTVNGGCTDVAGNTTTTGSPAFDFDATAPSVSGAPDRAPDHNGWYNHPVDVVFVGADDTSGIQACDTVSYSGPDGVGITVNGGCTDVAGNTTTTGSPAFDFDATAPSVTITTPADGGTYVKGSTVASSYSCGDGLSGVASCNGPVADGAPIDTASVGNKVFVVSASDEAGNTAVQSHQYTVVFAWLGFLRPIDNLPVVNVVKAGSAVPVKFSLDGNQGLGIFTSGSPSSQRVTCDTGSPQDSIETTVTAGGSSLSYDAATDQYTYVWKTDKAWASSCRVLAVTLVDGTTHQAAFKLTK